MLLLPCLCDDIYSKVNHTDILLEKNLQQQEGQHPLTGQRTANFRLLANQ